MKTTSALCLLLSLSISTLTATSATPAATTDTAPRERLLMDFGWKFSLAKDITARFSRNLSKAGQEGGPASPVGSGRGGRGRGGFSDANWRTVDLPHDWAIEMPFDQRADGSHGFRAVGRGFESNSVAWYRRTFTLPATDKAKRIWIEFDGVYRDAQVFVNGWFVGHHESGYSGFRYDITDQVNVGGTNVVAVMVDATQFEGWFYEGAGIYRHVWLVKTAPLALAPDGTFVYSEFKNNVPVGAARLHVQTRLLNSQSAPADAKVAYELLDPKGKSVAKFSDAGTLASWTQLDLEAASSISSPTLWSPESPNLYKFITTVTSDGKVVDRKETEFGIRTVGWDANLGFLLNGKPYVLKGTCNHQDHAGVGAALPDRLQYFRVAQLKEMGDNAYRTSHNAPTPELLEACDHLGMLVMDENRLLGSDAGNLERLEGQIRRDRNHPSVAMWSIANEESQQLSATGGRVAETMQNLVHRLDPTRSCTEAGNYGNNYTGISTIIDVRGWNYNISRNFADTNSAPDQYHRAHPNQPNVGTEQASTVATRGIYTNSTTLGYVSAYDTNYPSWAHTAEQWWTFFAARPWLSGGFIWTGFDYRGEPTPYSWPCINSHFGILDVCGFPKDDFYYYRAWWTTNTVLHILPHWNWAGDEGKEKDVWVLSNCEEVELFLNGESQGKKTMKVNSHLSWKVKYAPGTISARGYRNSKVIAESKVETTGEPAAVLLTPDRATINADGQDVSIFTVSVLDAQGRPVPNAMNLVSFDLTGPGHILGVGNGDPSSHESDIGIATEKMAPHTSALTFWKVKKVADASKADLPELTASFDDASWAKADVSGEDAGDLGGDNESGVYRTHLNLTQEQISAGGIQVQFGRIDDDGWVYVNGKKVGESHDWSDTPSYDITSSVHPGDNVIAVGVHNNDGAGGLYLGTDLAVKESTPAFGWQRSVFNGLAQILVQSSRQPGQLQLTATASGLRSASVPIQARAAKARPTVP